MKMTNINFECRLFIPVRSLETCESSAAGSSPYQNIHSSLLKDKWSVCCSPKVF